MWGKTTTSLKGSSGSVCDVIVVWLIKSPAEVSISGVWLCSVQSSICGSLLEDAAILARFKHTAIATPWPG